MTETQQNEKLEVEFTVLPKKQLYKKGDVDPTPQAEQKPEPQLFYVGDKVMMLSKDDENPGKVEVEVKEVKEIDGEKEYVVQDAEENRYQVKGDQLEVKKLTVE